jgi:hypothetical protein
LDAVEASGAIVLPFAWTAVTRYAAVGRLSAARVRIRRAGRDAMSILVTDDTGAPILSAGSLALRPTSADQLAESVDAAAEWLHRVEWAPMTLLDGEAGTGRWAVLADQPA